MTAVAARSERPGPTLKGHLAAIAHLYIYVLDLPDLTKRQEILYFNAALTKSGTKLPRQRSNVFPTQPFVDMFKSWPDNNSLTIHKLRLKTIVLLSLCLMLRPSDIAPRACLFDPHNPLSHKPLVFSTDNIVFNHDGSCDIVFHGIKQDTDRAGFNVHLPPAVDTRLDPVLTLKDYISRTEVYRPVGQKPVFLTISPPYHAISSDTVSNVLKQAIDLAGLAGQGYSAKSFRPTGATVAIDKGYNPKVVQRLGRWKTDTVFFEHYVHSRTQDSYTSDILSLR